MSMKKMGKFLMYYKGDITILTKNDYIEMCFQEYEKDRITEYARSSKVINQQYYWVCLSYLHYVAAYEKNRG